MGRIIETSPPGRKSISDLNGILDFMNHGLDPAVLIGVAVMLLVLTKLGGDYLNEYGSRLFWVNCLPVYLWTPRLSERSSSWLSLRR